MSTSKTEQPSTVSAGRRVSRDLVGGIGMLAVVAVFLGNAGEVGRGEYDWLFPVVLSYALAALGIVMVARGLLGRGSHMPLVPIVLQGKGVDVALFCVMTVLYVVLVPRVGFWIMSALMIVTAAVYLDTKRSTRGFVVSVVVAMAICLAGYLSLTEIFYIKFPMGTWGW